MQIDETQIVIGDEMGNKVPVIIYRCGEKYFIHNHCNVDSPLSEIDKEKAWDMLGIAESMKEILRKN